MSTTAQQPRRWTKPTASTVLVREEFQDKRILALTIKEASILAGVSVKTIQNWLSEGRIAYASRVGPFRVAKLELVKFLGNGVWTGSKRKKWRSRHK